MARKKIDKLSQEVSMALAAGMSYGKWKAMQPVKDVSEKAVAVPKNMKQCPHCKKMFSPSNGKQKFCEPFCQKEAYKDKNRMMCAENARRKRERQRLEKQKREEQGDGK